MRRALRARLKPPPAKVVLYVHLSRTPSTARLEQGNQLVTAGQVRDWCGTAGRVVVKPVLDLEAHDPVDSDVVPDRHAELTAVRDKTCVFPWCTRPPESLRHRPHHPRIPWRTNVSVQPGKLLVHPRQIDTLVAGRDAR